MYASVKCSTRRKHAQVEITVLAVYECEPTLTHLTLNNRIATPPSPCIGCRLLGRHSSTCNQ
jgi:hypothetical protein